MRPHRLGAWRLSSHQPGHPHQVVGRPYEVTGKARAVQDLGSASSGIRPPSQTLTEGIAAMPGRASIDSSAPARLLRQVRVTPRARRAPHARIVHGRAARGEEKCVAPGRTVPAVGRSPAFRLFRGPGRRGPGRRPMGFLGRKVAVERWGLKAVSVMMCPWCGGRRRTPAGEVLDVLAGLP